MIILLTLFFHVGVEQVIAAESILYMAEFFPFGQFRWQPRPDSMKFEYSAGAEHEQFTDGFFKNFGLYTNLPSRDGLRFAAWSELKILPFDSQEFVLSFDMRYEQPTSAMKSEALVKLLSMDNKVNGDSMKP